MNGKKMLEQFLIENAKAVETFHTEQAKLAKQWQEMLKKESK